MDQPNTNDMNDEALARELERIEKEEREEREAEKRNAALKKIRRAELKKRHEQTQGGKEGEAFNIVETPGGFVVVKKREGVVMKNFRKSDMSDPVVEDFIKAHVVEPAWEDVIAILDKWDACRSDLMGACAALHGHREFHRGKK